MSSFEWTCSVCGEGNAKTALACSNCGSASPHTPPPAVEANPSNLCHSCGHSVEGKDRFCPQCGIDLLKKPEALKSESELAQPKRKRKSARQSEGSPKTSDTSPKAASLIIKPEPSKAEPDIHKSQERLISSIRVLGINISYLAFRWIAISLFLFFVIFGGLPDTIIAIPITFIGLVIGYYAYAKGKKVYKVSTILSVIVFLTSSLLYDGGGFNMLAGFMFTVLFVSTIFSFRSGNDNKSDVLNSSGSQTPQAALTHPKEKQEATLHPKENPTTSDAKNESSSKKSPAGDSIQTWTGVVTTTERENPINGNRGTVMGVRIKNKFTNIVRFRITLHDQAGGAIRQIAAQVVINHTDVYLQEGDIVTLVGKMDAKGALNNPGIINHSGNIIILPIEKKYSLKYWGSATLFMCFMFYQFGSFRESENAAIEIDAAARRLGSTAPSAFANVIHFKEIFICFFLVFLCFNIIRPLLYIFQSGRLHDKIKAKISEKLRSTTLDTWSIRTYQNPQGIVEGVCLFSRGFPDPVEWVVFRMGIYDDKGQLLDWLVGASPQHHLAAELRKGDLVRWAGNYTTGKIHRPRIQIMSLK